MIRKPRVQISTGAGFVLDDGFTWPNTSGDEFTSLGDDDPGVLYGHRGACCGARHHARRAGIVVGSRPWPGFLWGPLNVARLVRLPKVRRRESGCVVTIGKKPHLSGGCFFVFLGFSAANRWVR